ncbi:hypothetical protein NL501_28055, partial [Klebsiella pneumoniae]|nr:hypothetical protein [Klebsiella pneumoniae]
QVNCDLARTGPDYYPNVRLPDFVDALLTALDLDNRFPRHDVPHNAPQGLLGVGAPATALSYATFFDTLVEFAQEHRLWETSTLILGESSSL